MVANEIVKDDGTAQDAVALHQALKILMTAAFTSPRVQTRSSFSAAIGIRPPSPPSLESLQSKRYKVLRALVDCVRPDMDHRSYSGKSLEFGVGFVTTNRKEFLSEFAGIANQIVKYEGQANFIPQQVMNEALEVIAAAFHVERFGDLETAFTHQNLAEGLDHSRVWLRKHIQQALILFNDPEVPGKHSYKRDLMVWGEMYQIAEGLKVDIAAMAARDVIDANVTKIISASAEAETNRLTGMDKGSWVPPLQGMLHGIKAGVDDLQDLSRNQFYQSKIGHPSHKGSGIDELTQLHAKAQTRYDLNDIKDSDLVPEIKTNDIDRTLPNIPFFLDRPMSAKETKLDGNYI